MFTRENALNILNSIEKMKKEFNDNPDLYKPYHFNDGTEAIVEGVKTIYTDYKKDKEVALGIVKLASLPSYEFKQLSNELKRDSDIIHAVISEYHFAFQDIPADLKADKDFMLKSVSINGLVLEYASPELQNDKEVVLAAIKQNGYALGSASRELQDDKEVVLAAVGRCGDALKYASEELRSSKDVVLFAASNDYKALEYASKDLKADKDVALAALLDLKSKKDNYLSVSLENFYKLGVARKLRNDPSFMMEAIKIYPKSYLYAFNAIKEKPEMFAAFCKYSDKESIWDIPAIFQDNKSAVLAAVTNYGNNIRDASPRLKDDKDVVIAAVSNYSHALCYASDRLKDDPEVVRAAVSHHQSAIQYASERIQKNPELLVVKRSFDDIAKAAQEKAAQRETNIPVQKDKTR